MTPSWMDALDLEPEAIGDPDAVIPLPSPAVGSMHTMGTLSTISEIVAAEPATLEVARLPGLIVHAWSTQADVVLVVVEPEATVLRHSQAAPLDPTEWVLDGRGERPAAILLRDSHGERVLTVHEGNARLYGLATLAPLAGDVVLDVPPLGPLLDAHEIETWLRERTESLWTSEDAFSRAAGVGTLARYWAPVDRATALQMLLGGVVGPIEQLRGWARELSEADRSGLLRIARDEVGACEGILDEMLQASRQEQGETAGLLFVDLMERRDLLASVRWVLGAGPSAPTVLDDDLAALDARVRAHWSDRPELVGEEERVWGAELANREPHAWWAAR